MYIQDMLHEDMLEGIWTAIWVTEQELRYYSSKIKNCCNVKGEIPTNVAAIKRGATVTVAPLSRGEVVFQVIGRGLKTQAYLSKDEKRIVIKAILNFYGEENVVFLKGHDEF